MRVVVVEDHDDSRMLVAEVLRMNGFAVAEYPSASVALQAMEETAADVILTDLTLADTSSSAPPEGGAELARAVRARPEMANVPVIALTGRTKLADAERGLFDEVLVKPVDPMKLAKTIFDAMKRRRQALDSPPSSF